MSDEHHDVHESTPSPLTAAAVEEMMGRCLRERGEQEGATIAVAGVVASYVFDRDRIAANAERIGAMLAELPDQFHANRGQGWSFLNACEDRHGRQWTDLHLTMEALFALGIACGRARWNLPRDIWPALPGGMPYVTVAPKGGLLP